MPADAAPVDRLRIAVVSPYDLSRPGGVQGQVRGLAASLVALGHAAAVIAPDDRRPGWVPGGPAAQYAAGRAVAVPANGSMAPLALSPAASARAVRAVREWEADVVHLHEPLAPFLGYGFLASRRWPVVATFHRGGGGGRASAAWAPFGRWATRHIDVRCAVSEEARRTASAVCGGRYEVLFNGVDLARFRAGGEGEAVGAPPAVLFLGRHERRKGLAVLLDAFSAVRSPAELWVAGSGPDTDRLRAEHPGNERVRWLGMLDDAAVAERLRRATVLCAPSLGGESFGMVLLEGMAAGCAVVASDIPGYREAAGGHATLAPPGDADALGAALDRVLAAPPDPAALAAARGHAEAWSMDRLAQRYVELYRRTCDVGGGTIGRR
jgi:phosphatidyl-myo-inositol alpha-mannosyltransferase